MITIMTSKHTKRTKKNDQTKSFFPQRCQNQIKTTLKSSSKNTKSLLKSPNKKLVKTKAIFLCSILFLFINTYDHKSNHEGSTQTLDRTY